MSKNSEMSTSDSPVFIFSDPGIDDVVAISLAILSKKFKVIGAYGTAGNVSAETATDNLARIFTLYGLDPPLYKGREIARSNFPAPIELIHGKNGLADIEVPRGTGSPFGSRNKDEIQIMFDSADKINIVSMAPLTDIADILRDYPQIKLKISELVIMGGGFSGGNITGNAEFNIYCNPRAANQVFRSGVNIKLIPLDITEEVRLYPADIEPLLRCSDQKISLVGKMLEFYFDFHERTAGFRGCYVHDPLTVLYLLSPQLFSFKKAFVYTEERAGPYFGRTYASWDDRNAEIYLQVATSLEVEKAKSVLLHYLQKSK